MKTIVFNDDTRDILLAVFNKAVDDDGYIIEKTSGNRVLTPNGDDVRVEDFAGFAPGSEIVLTKDLPSLLSYVKTDG